jgi:hypothetical protein
MFYTSTCPRRPIGTSLGLDWDENSYLGNDRNIQIRHSAPYVGRKKLMVKVEERRKINR